MDRHPLSSDAQLARASLRSTTTRPSGAALASALALATAACNLLTGSAELEIACDGTCEVNAPRRTTTSSTEPIDAGADRRRATEGQLPSDTSRGDGGLGATDDGAAAGSAPRVSCGKQGCGGAASECCIEREVTACVSGPDACSGVRMRCDEAADCGAAQVCCLDGILAPNEAACTERSKCRGPNASVMCRTTADCALGQLCIPFLERPEYAGCAFL